MAQKFYVRVHENTQGRVVALCDSNLVGKVHEKNGQALDLIRYGGFYKGEEVSGKEALKKLGSFSSLNIVGKEAVALAIKGGLVDKNQVGEIAGLKHVQVFRI